MKIKNRLTISLTEGEPLKLILLFSIPIFFGQLFQIGYSLIDTKIVGSILGESALASVGSVSTLSVLLTQFFSGLTMGFSVLAARYFGGGEEKKLKQVLAGGILFGFGTTLVLSAFALIFMEQILQVLRVQPGQYYDAYQYIVILTTGMVITTAYNLCANMMRAVGDSMTPLIYLVISTVANTGMDYVFIKWFDWGVAGAAYATVLAQLLSVVLCVIRILRGFPMLRVTLADFDVPGEIYALLVKGGMSMGLMSCLVNFGTLALQAGINQLGTETIVAHTAARKAFEVFLLPPAILATTMATFAGQNFGAKRYDRIKKGLWSVLGLCAVWCIMIVLITFTLSDVITGFIASTKDPNILYWSGMYLKINMPFVIVCCVIIVLRNSMQGFGDHLTPVISSGIELAGKLVFAFVFVRLFDYWGIIWAEPVVWILMVIILIVQTIRNPYLRGKKEPEITK